MPTVGITLSYHFCGDYVHSVNFDFSSNNKEPNDCCGLNEKNNDGCCHNEIKIFRLNENHSPSFKVELTSEQIIVAFIPIEIKQEITFNNFYQVTNQEFPPGKNITIKNQLLLI